MKYCVRSMGDIVVERGAFGDHEELMLTSFSKLEEHQTG